MSDGNISCLLLRLDTGSWSPAGSIDFFTRTVAFFRWVMWIFYWQFIILGLTLNGPNKRSNHNLSISVPCRSTSNAPPLLTSSPQLFRSIARSSSVTYLSSGFPIWQSPSCRNVFSALTRSLLWPHTVDTSMVRVFCLWIFSTNRIVELSVHHTGVIIKFNNTIFSSQINLLFLYLMSYSGNIFRLITESPFSPYIRIQVLNIL